MLHLLSDLVNLVYPQVCAACGTRLQEQEQTLCIGCEHTLPITSYHIEPDNPVAKHFWGRVPLKNASALYLYNKGERVQQLIHRLKYKGWKEIGVKVGQIYGRLLAKTETYRDISLILPVPLHPDKKIQRGYNQSDCFAQGLSETMKIPWSDSILVRKLNTATQTKKAKFARWENVSAVFAVEQPHRIQNKHILLVDDVITTGATIEACAQILLQHEGVTLSAAGIAHAM